MDAASIVSSAPMMSRYTASRVMSLAASPRPPGRTAALARCWLEENWVRPARWSWPMCRMTAFLAPLERLEVADIVALTGWDWQDQRGILF